jgi:hypothetical protein
LEEYNLLLENRKILTGLHISEGEIIPVQFSLDQSPRNNNTKKVTAKEVQKAIKNKTVTPELLQAEIDRINAREERAKELDMEKIQLQVHETFQCMIEKSDNKKELTGADLVAAKLLIYQSLDYAKLDQVRKVLFPALQNENENLYELFSKLTDQQYSYLIRMAVAGKSESKYPNNISAYTLYQTAKSAGIDVIAIETEQQLKAKDREAKQKERINELEKRIKKLTPSA